MPIVPHRDPKEVFNPLPVTDEPSRPAVNERTITSRQCGRCRAMFPGDPTLHPIALAEWWLCPPCRITLLGTRARRPRLPVVEHRSDRILPAEVIKTSTAARLRREASRPAPVGRPPERAQLVWLRALELVDPPTPQDRFGLALDLLRAAHLDAATMAHALSLGRNHSRTHPEDALGRAGVAILQAAVAYLGVRTRVGDIAGAHR